MNNEKEKLKERRNAYEICMLFMEMKKSMTDDYEDTYHIVIQFLKENIRDLENEIKKEPL